jgi:UDP-N-acetylglucosamine 2-epimerase (non-hydrolysing)
MPGIKKILIVIGTRPEAIKMAPVIKELKRRERFSLSVCLTAQHREMLDQAIKTFDIPVDYDLDLMEEDQVIADVCGEALQELEGVFYEAEPDLVLVQGDTTTAFAAALAAYYNKIPVGHIEAGLRTHDKSQPFPEEMNRRLIDALSDHHFAPTREAEINLLEEDIPSIVTGNTGIDALLDVAARPYVDKDLLFSMIEKGNKLILVTAHRRESYGEPLVRICKAVEILVKDNPGIEIVFLVHPNPNVRKTVGENLEGKERIHLIESLEYLPFVQVLKESYLVLTDSGGLQEEAPALNKPVLVMRDRTERPEGISAGCAKMVGTSIPGITTWVETLLEKPLIYKKMAESPNPYGDGLASKRIADHLEELKR